MTSLKTEIKRGRFRSRSYLLKKKEPSPEAEAVTCDSCAEEKWSER